MSILATCFMALPAVLLCLIPYVLLAGDWLPWPEKVTPTRKRRCVLLAAPPSRSPSKRANTRPVWPGPVLALNVRLTRWEKTLSSWLQLDSPKDESHG